MTLEIYMKSGNIIKLKYIKEYEIQNRGNEIIGLSITKKYSFGRKLLVKTIDLSQIEAIVVNN